MQEELASFLGPEQCAVIGVDDKAKVPLGIPAAHKQQAILMRVEKTNKVRLPDHTFVVAGAHKLTPSVCAVQTVEPNRFGDRGAVKSTGPTSIFVRSGKHDTSTPYDHVVDIIATYQQHKAELWNKSSHL